MKILAVSATLALALSGCADNNNNGIADSREDDCRPPYACGAFYANYIPMYYATHPYSLYMSPYSSMYSYNYSGGRMVPKRTTTRPFTANNVRIAAPRSKVNFGAKTPAQQAPKAKTGNVGTGSGTKVQAPPRVKTGSGSSYKSSSGKR